MNSIKIGKKLIITLTTGMYEDSRFIYREYIQNSADQIDIAIKEGLLDEQNANIIINIDKPNRNITFYDNATGIKSEKVREILGNVADSSKSGIDTKGFIGIGRLGGLGYCDKLQFVTSFKGENLKTIMTWDANKLHDLINDKSVDDDAAQVIQQVIDIRTEPVDAEDHFFEVKLLSIKKGSNSLLDVDSIREYLSMVAPVPFDCAFYLSGKIKKHIDDHQYDRLSEYRILINNEQLFKAYRKNIYRVVGSKKEKCDELNDLGFKEFKLNNGELAAWMWYGISNLETQINKSGNIQRGLRFRCKNIQIGDDSTIVTRKFFKEDRGNHYFVGEIHVVHPLIKPNSRRDYFVDSETLTEFEHLLRDFCSGYLHGLYYNANVLKNTYKKEIELSDLNDKLKEKQDTGFASPIEETKLKDKIETTQNELSKKLKASEKIIDKAENDNTLKTVVNGLTKKYKKSTVPVEVSDEDSNGINNTEKKLYLTQKLSNLNSKQRKVVNIIFDIIHKVLPPDKADELVQRICEELKN